MDLLAAFAQISLFEMILVGAVALFASIVGGVTGYGSSALMPLVLVPLIGPEPVIPIVSLSGLFNNTTRAYAFREYVDWKRGTVIMLAAVPTCMFGAYVYTRLTSAGILIAIGAMLCLSVPLRRWVTHMKLQMNTPTLAGGSVVYGFLAGSTTGSGVVLLSLLMASGLAGAWVVATDALVSVAVAVAKLTVFGVSGVMTPQVLAFGLLIGVVALPGAFLAKAFVERLPVHVHTGILDAIVVLGGATMVFEAVKRLI
jgi:uncharacterized membrane protein YfcA